MKPFFDYASFALFLSLVFAVVLYLLGSLPWVLEFFGIVWVWIVSALCLLTIAVVFYATIETCD